MDIVELIEQLRVGRAESPVVVYSNQLAAVTAALMEFDYDVISSIKVDEERTLLSFKNKHLKATTPVPEPLLTPKPCYSDPYRSPWFPGPNTTPNSVTFVFRTGKSSEKYTFLTNSSGLAVDDLVPLTAAINAEWEWPYLNNLRPSDLPQSNVIVPPGEFLDKIEKGIYFGFDYLPLLVVDGTNLLLRSVRLLDAPPKSDGCRAVEFDWVRVP